ncbi:hypothetical protein [Plantactinospora sonchi]|uniref:Uncharacterized protein n=1 Tax=Plantactinospora sonchi TaxID=1544735 RepID=A0ABU7RRN9_9ACTN
MNLSTHMHRLAAIAAEIGRTIRGRSTEDVVRARLRSLDLPRRRRRVPRPDRAARSWYEPTPIIGLPLLTYGQQRLYRVEPC